MGTERAIEVEDEADAGTLPGIGTRLLSLGALLLVVSGFGWLILQIVSVFANAWVAPINLSPDNDHVINLNLQVARQLAEVERAEADVHRFALEMASLDESITRLSQMNSRSNEVFRWEAEIEDSHADTVARSVRALTRQQRVLATERERQAQAVQRARTNLEAGLIGRHDLENEEHALAQIDLAIANNERAMLEARMQQQVARLQSDTYRAAVDGSAPPSVIGGQMPTVAQRQDSAIRLQLEITRMQAERRGLQDMHDTGVRNLTRLREALDQLRERPLYRATQESLDVGFIPYEQLDGVHPGAEVVQCTFWIFACHQVGHVTEVLPGEVVTQDPWGELARGRYAVLHLDDPLAVQERILRVR